ncbi:MAG: phospholipid/cholesterol/gamma-HCH transport system permease protein [Azoarcus sp.]|uniref:Phospholipid/cholesterol/gamma-HCH transport system permease protein n=1 Tax=Aromatoleum tolulyticum TaxID=34027 RepID=A0A1N6XWM1_9RHOO|nr:MlaE family lipid ABC transporter permease subunit [Aromatoleum tolulyticum]MCK9984231.1 phospholipid/cholesterol/gamma-HCH transport system permease protein [Azoarcus sp.]SIR06805.1 phospholipid/cholesterol/gamma-HCH transport system permease protein [Aromatoleum tolulyticum]
MNRMSAAPAAIAQSSPQELALSGAWTARGIGAIASQLDALTAPAGQELVVDGARIEALDTAGAWVLQKLVHRLSGEGKTVRLRDLRPEFTRLLEAIEQQMADQEPPLASSSIAPASALERLGRNVVASLEQGFALLSFVGECALALGGCLAHPARFRWRPILYNIRSAGFDALPIVGLLSFLLGVVVAYQGANQLRQYGANIFVADLVGLSMLREFAPLITAIIVAGRSGSAYAAQIGTMAVTEEIDAMRTLGIAPLDLLVLPKVLALLVALPLLTVFADVLGVFGGMLMARAQLGVGFADFLDRFVKAVSVTAYLIGVGKAPVFAAIIAVVGCFQGFRTHGGADSVGRQTTRAVVQSIFLVIVADALFSVAFSALDL